MAPIAEGVTRQVGDQKEGDTRQHRDAGVAGSGGGDKSDRQPKGVVYEVGR